MNSHSEGYELIVPASRLKLVAVALGAAPFVLLGAWMVSLAPQQGAVVAILGAAAAAFFGLLVSLTLSVPSALAVGVGGDDGPAMAREQRPYPVGTLIPKQNRSSRSYFALMRISSTRLASP